MAKTKKTHTRNKVQAGQKPDPKDGNAKARYIMHYRMSIMAVFRAIREGRVSEEELDRLQNFCQFSLNAMQRLPMTDIQGAWRDTEIFGHIHDEEGATFVDHQIILDPAKQGQSVTAVQSETTASTPSQLPGRIRDSIDKWIDEEFTAYEKLDEVEKAMVRNAATMASGLQGDVTPDQILAGNTHNTTELSLLHADLVQTMPAASVRFTDDQMEYKLFGFLWHGRKIILCDDGIGVFVSRATAREVYRTYGPAQSATAVGA